MDERMRYNFPRVLASLARGVGENALESDKAAAYKMVD